MEMWLDPAKLEGVNTKGKREHNLEKHIKVIHSAGVWWHKNGVNTKATENTILRSTRK